MSAVSSQADDAAMENLTKNESYRTAIVLLDPVTEWKPVLDAALRLGLLVIAVQISPINDSMKQFVPSSLMLEEAGASYVLDPQDRDVFSCIQGLNNIVEQDEEKNPNQSQPLKIGAVIPLSETAVDFVDILSASLGVATYNPLDQVLPKRDKGFMKDAVRKSGLPIANFARLWNYADLPRYMESLSLEYPVVIKTPQGFSSSDVYICSSQEQAQKALNHILNHKGPDGRTPQCALLEEYIGGTEFAVNLIGTSRLGGTDTGDLVVTDVWKYEKTEQAQYKGATLCDLTDYNLREICKYAKGVAKAVGIEYGAAHVELKAQPSCDDNNVVSYINPIMMEVGARLSGGRKATMTHVAYGGSWDPFGSLIQSHMGKLELPTAMPSPLHDVLHIFLPVHRSGRIRNISCILNGPKESQRNHLQTLHSHVWMVKVGQWVGETKDITSCAGFVWLVGRRDLVEKDADAIRSSYRIEFEDES